MIYHGDLFAVLPTLEAASVDACVTDGPYGIGFMGREWDTFTPGAIAANERKAFKARHGFNLEDPRRTNPNLKGRERSPAISPSQIEYDYSLKGLRGFQAFCERWGAEVFRVLKPGAYILSCGAPRAYHRMACGLEEAGFEVRDSIAWLFGQGFPKSLNLEGGRGTALKPAHEPIILARKPFKGSVLANVERHGTGALNIDACRIQFASEEDKAAAAAAAAQRTSHTGLNGSGTFARTGDVQTSIDGYIDRMDKGRWPANVALDDVAGAALDEQSGESQSGDHPGGGIWAPSADGVPVSRGYGDRGGASRFFYCAKPSREERDFGCADLPARSGGDATDRKDGSAGLKNPRAGAGRTGGARNIHPTVKPLELMRWLVRLVTPADGLVLDPFLGSGTTGMACREEHRRFLGIEQYAPYVEIARRRISAVSPIFYGDELVTVIRTTEEAGA